MMLRCLTLIALGLGLMASPLLAQRTEPKAEPDEQLRKLDSAIRWGAENVEDEEEDVSGRTEWFYFQRRFPFDVIPAGVRADAIRQVQRMQDRLDEARSKSGARVLAANRWEQIGPYNIAGRVKAIAVDARIPGLIYIGAAAGGVWKNEGEANKWTTTFDQQSAIAVNALDVDTSGRVWAGTGEVLPPNSNNNSALAYMGDGVFMSSDQGQTWKNMGLRNVGAFSKIFVHRQNPQIIYAAAMQANAGFYRSTDGGQTWSGPSPSGSVNDMAVNPLNGNTVFIATPNGVRRSTNGGKSFTTISSSGMSGVRLCVALAASDTNVVYVLVAKYGGPNGTNLCEFYRSGDRGDTWTKMPNDPSFDDGTFFNKQGWYDMSLAVHPEDKNVVLAAGIDVYQTANGGGSWQNTTLSYQGGDVHPDQHILTFDPISGVVYLGDDGGVYRSFDYGTTWERLSNSLPISQFYAIDIDQTRDFRAFGGTQDNGTLGSISGTTSWPKDWAHLLGGDGFVVVVDKTDPSIVYGESQYGNMSRIYGPNYSYTRGLTGNIPSNDNAPWTSPMAQSPADKTTLYCSRSNLYRCLNPRTGNPVWQTLTPGNSSPISSIGLSPFDANVIVVGTAGGEVRYSTDNGASWRSSTGQGGRFVSDIVFDPVTPNRVYLTISGTDLDHVYRSNNNGASFVSVSGNLPKGLTINAIEIDPENNQHLFVGSDAGTFASLNGGEFWFPFNDGLPYAPVTDLRIHSSTRMLVAGTHGRSMFRVNIDNIEAPAVLISPQGGETYGAPGTIQVRWANLNGPARVKLSFDGGASYPVVVEDIIGSEATLQVGVVRTNNAKVVVESMDGSIVLSSNAFQIMPSPNVVELGTRGLRSEAIEIRNGELWATQRNSDSIVRLRTPILSPLTKQVVHTSGISGTVRDMAYDASEDMFYMLVANADFTGAKVYRMDTLGVARGEVTLPSTSVSGIAVASDGLSIVTPGEQGRIYVINPSDGSIVRQGLPMENARGGRRIGLVNDGLGFEQAVVDASPSVGLEGELQRISPNSLERVIQFAPIITNGGDIIHYFGLAVELQALSDSTAYTYYATDTSGSIYRFSNLLSDVRDRTISASTSASLSIASVTPNPTRATAEIEYSIATGQMLAIELFTASGERVEELYRGVAEAGRHTHSIDARLLSSGIYYVAISSASGERAIHPIVVMK